MLKDNIIHKLTECNVLRTVTFMQCGVTPHIKSPVMHVLGSTFAEERLLSRYNKNALVMTHFGLHDYNINDFHDGINDAL